MLQPYRTFNSVGVTAKTSMSGDIPIWQNPEDLQKHQGGFAVSNMPLATTLVPGGTPIKVDEAVRTAAICFQFEVYEDATDSATAIKVVKYSTKYGNLAKVGMNLMKEPATLATTGAAYPIAAGGIDTTTSALYDILTLETTLGVALTAGDLLIEADSEHATDAVVLYTPNALTYADILVDDDDPQQTCAGVYFGSIYNRRIRKVAAIERAALTQINFSESK